MTQNKRNKGFYLQCVLEVFNIVAIDIYNQQSIKDIVNKRCVQQSRQIIIGVFAKVPSQWACIDMNWLTDFVAFGI